MTKTLTEQWRDGTLERGYYYYKTKVGAKVIGYQYFGLKFPYNYNHNTIDSVKEVLAPVPSYNELTLMRGNYILAKNALRDCYNEMKYWATMNHRCSKIFNLIKAALVEIEEVK